MKNDYQSENAYQLRKDLDRDFQAAFEMLKELGVDVSEKLCQKKYPILGKYEKTA